MIVIIAALSNCLVYQVIVARDFQSDVQSVQSFLLILRNARH
jgi:hypothetical protein